MSLLYDYYSAHQYLPLNATVFELTGISELLHNTFKSGQVLDSMCQPFLPFPYKICWFEYQGFFFDINNEYADFFQKCAISAVTIHKSDLKFNGVLARYPEIPPEVHYKAEWIIACGTYLLHDKRVRPFQIFFFYLDESRRIIDKEPYVYGFECAKGFEEFENFNRAIIDYLWFISQLLSSKNISYADHEPKPLTKKQKRRGEKQGVSFKTIVIDTDDTYYFRSKAQDPKNHNALHMCRGHFVTYTDDNKLFGKYTGRYWRRPHLRGKNKDAVNINDYKVIGEAA